MYRIVITQDDLAQAVSQLQRGQPQVRTSLDILYTRDGVELLVHDAKTDQAAAGTLLVELDRDEDWFSDDIASGQIVVRLLLSWDTNRAMIRGLVRWTDRKLWEPLHSLRVVGEAMQDIVLVGSTVSTVSFDFGGRQRDSRLIGAVGGMETRKALEHLRVAVIGCGGLGSLIADQLARLMGRTGRIDLFDPDILEAHNLPSWLLFDREEVGKAKVGVLAGYLQGLPYASVITGHQVSILDDVIQALLKPAQLLVCTVDSPKARLAAGFFSAVYRRPLLVIETGVFLGADAREHRRRMAPFSPTDFLPGPLVENGPRTRQADVRLLLPIAGGCMLCTGGIGGELDEFQRTFWRNRAGTLMPLNQEAVGRGMRLLLGWLNHEVTQSVHLRLDESVGATGQWHIVDSIPRRDCPLCKRLGRGDSARNEFQLVIDEIRERGL